MQNKELISNKTCIKLIWEKQWTVQWDFIKNKTKHEETKTLFGIENKKKKINKSI